MLPCHGGSNHMTRARFIKTVLVVNTVAQDRLNYTAMHKIDNYTAMHKIDNYTAMHKNHVGFFPVGKVF